MAYPVAVYAGAGHIPALVFVALGLALTLLHVRGSRGAVGSSWRWTLLVGVVVLLLMAAIDDRLAARAYPVILSFAAAAAFGLSLVTPPSMIERFARLRTPDLGPDGQAYCRRMTWIWTAWLISNGVIAGSLALGGSDWAWTLWTGVISYMGMGVLLAAEWVLRPKRPRGVGDGA